MTKKKQQLVIEDLSRDDSLALVAEKHLGRLAFAFRDRVDIEPISYVYEDGWIYARTAPGTKLTTVHHTPYVALEVDDVRDRLHWKSVVLRGTIYFIEPERGPVDEEAYASALRVLRSADAGILTDEDPTPYRRFLFRIHVDEVTGRQASPG